uniref:Protein preY, mitochondrial n=1 Tax=Gadus morhua TaxID=8049 RepID=A0A8C5AL96_GADMO
MFQHALRRLTTETRSIQRYVRYAPSFHSVPFAFVSTRNFTNVKDDGEQPFDTSLLDFLVCPLSKKPLRYEVTTNELINEELGIAYPIIDGIPNMIPQDARLLQKDTDMPADPTQG